MKRVIFWFRRDLRLNDNRGLLAACRDAEEVIPVFILSTWNRFHRWTGPARQQFLCGSLEALAHSLDAIGGRLIFREGPADEALEKLLLETHAEAIYFNYDPDPHGRMMENLVRSLAKSYEIPMVGHQDVALHGAGEVLKRDGKPYKVFTAYAKAWAKLHKPVAGQQVTRMQTPAVRSVGIPTLEYWGLQSNGKMVPPGEAAARRRMERFFSESIRNYSELKDIPGEGATSRLSQDLRFGLISIRELYHKCRDRSCDAVERKSIRSYVNELVWREFFLQLLWHCPEVLDVELKPAYRGLSWSNPERERSLERWSEGETGFPIVDAAMRQLNATGFMHNRLRMITATFLTKYLHIDWREGEMVFMQKLVDGEIASNNGGWQWCAGTGANTAPQSQFQNPWLQSKRFDPDGRFIKHWLPELRDVPAKKLHEPPQRLQIAKGYPFPMVDHHNERAVAIEMFRETASKLNSERYGGNRPIHAGGDR